MAKADVRIYDAGGLDVVPTLSWGVAAGTPSAIGAGRLARIGSLPNAVEVANGEGTTSERIVGVSKNDSTETASVAGTCEIYMPIQGIIYSAPADTATEADTDAEIIALKGIRTTLTRSADTTAGTQSVNTGVADAATNGLLIVGGNASDANRPIIYFALVADVTVLGA